MLISKPLAANDIISFRMTNGELIVAKFLSLDTTYLTVTKPVVANPVQNDKGFGIYFSPFAASIDEDEKYRLPVTALMFMPLPPRSEITQSYLKMTTGLDIPA